MEIAYEQAKLSKLPGSLTEAVHQMKHSELAIVNFLGSHSSIILS